MFVFYVKFCNKNDFQWFSFSLTITTLVCLSRVSDLVIVFYLDLFYFIVMLLNIYILFKFYWN